MSWLRLDDQVAFHEKIVAAGNAVTGAWVRAAAWSAGALTEGRIPREIALTIAPKRVWDRMVAARAGHVHGLAEVSDDGWIIHDYLKWNPLASSVKLRRERDRERLAKWREKQAESRSGNAVTNAVSTREVTPPPSPSPSPSPSPRSQRDSAPIGAGPAPSGRSDAEAPKRERKRAKEPADAEPIGPKPETPVQRAWRTWRAEYQRTYQRAYPAQTTDGPAMLRAAKLAGEMLETLTRPADDLEALLVHRWRKYLADPGGSRVPGGPGFLRENSHPLQHFERGLASYGTPWDRAERAAAPGPRAAPPVTGNGRGYAGRSNASPDPLSVPAIGIPMNGRGHGHGEALPVLPLGGLFGQAKAG